MAAKQLPDLAYLVECFECDSEAGTLVWKMRPRHHFCTERGYRHYIAGSRAGKRADWLHEPTGYRFIQFSTSLYKAHRIVWKMVTGQEPEDFLDHINGDRSDNRISNLREATDLQNRHNAGKRKNNTSGLRGAFSTPWGFLAQIGVNRKTVYLGYFNTAEDAHAAYCEAAQKLHGKFFHKD